MNDLTSSLDAVDGATTEEIKEVETLRKRVEKLENSLLLLTDFLVDRDPVTNQPVMMGKKTRGLSPPHAEPDSPAKDAAAGGGGGVSLVEIDRVVDRILSEANTNFGWIPDFMERKIDRRILQLILGLLAQTLSTASVSFGDGHELTFSIHPAGSADQTNTDRSSSPPRTGGPATSGAGNFDPIILNLLKSVLDPVHLNFWNHTVQPHVK